MKLSPADDEYWFIYNKSEIDTIEFILNRCPEKENGGLSRAWIEGVLVSARESYDQYEKVMKKKVVRR